MSTLINKSVASKDSPTPLAKWVTHSDQKKKELIRSEILNSKLLDEFEVISTDTNGNIILKIEKSIPAKERGILLLNVEKILKEKIDEALVIWLEPVGDKSKLRNLRGIEIKPDK